MDPIRTRQFAIWKSMTVAERWALMGDVIDAGLAVREQRLREAHPGAGPEELRLLRRRLLLADSVDHVVP